MTFSHSVRRVLPAVVTGFVAMCLAAAPIAACPFCTTPSLTLAEQVAQSDAVVLVKWVSGTMPGSGVAGSTMYEVVQAAKAPAKFPIAKGDQIKMDLFRAGKKGDLFLLIGSAGTRIEWGSPLEITETGFQYMSQAPSPEQPVQERLVYFLKFLEFPDELVANDAFAEFAGAPYKDILSLAKSLPRERLRKWVSSSTTPATRLGMYGMLLGLCGNEEDVALLEKRITEPTEDFRLGIDGVMGGYLLLTGDKGLDVIDQTKLKKGVKFANGKSVPFSETYAGLSALRFMWQYGDGKIEKDRLRKSMRLLLDRPELADMVVIDLARWKDWGVEDQLFKLFDDEAYNVPSIKRAIVRYYLAALKDAPKEEAAAVPAHVTKAKELLEKLREKDEQIVKDAERFSFGS